VIAFADCGCLVERGMIVTSCDRYPEGCAEVPVPPSK